MLFRSRLTCTGLAAAAGDAPMPEPWNLDVHSLSDLFVRAALPVGGDVAADEVTVELVFSTPVTLEAARQAVTASPAITRGVGAGASAATAELAFTMADGKVYASRLVGGIWAAPLVVGGANMNRVAIASAP